MLTSRDLAELAGVSQITVSRALNNSPLVKTETRERIKRLAREHRFELNSFAQSMRTNKTGSIGLMLAKHFTHTNQNLYASSLLGFLLLELETSGYDIIPTTNRGESGNRSHIESILAKRKIDGLIVLRNDVSPEVFEMLAFYKIPCVFITQSEPDPRFHYSIRLDHRHSGYLVGEHFARKGLTSVATIGGPQKTPDTMARLRGFSDGLGDNGVILNPAHIFCSDYSYEAGYNLTKNNLSVIRHIQGIYYQNDPCAIGGIKALHEGGIDLSAMDIVSGDGTPVTEWNTPSLTTVYAPAHQIAREAVNLICRLLKDSASVPDSLHIVVQPALIIRESSVGQTDRG